MKYAYYDRLSAAQKRIYDQSDGIRTVGLPSPERCTPHIRAVARALKRRKRPEVETAVRRLAGALVKMLGVPPVRVRVMAARPAKSWGELQGLYEPQEGRRRACITVWMRTAQRKQVVAFKTFLRTFIHELLHHLDYELFHLDETFHTLGFYRRESSLFHQLTQPPRRTPHGASSLVQAQLPFTAQRTSGTS